MRFVHYYPRAMADSGVTIALWAWARAQASMGYEVLVLHDGPPPQSNPRKGFADTGPMEGVAERRIPHRGRGQMAHPLRLGDCLNPGDILVLHEGWRTSNLAAAAAAGRALIPYIVMPHGVYDSSWQQYLRPPRLVRNKLERHLLEHALAVHVFFASEIPDITALAPRARFFAVPTGYVLPEERWTGEGGYISWIGRIDPFHKGLDLLIGAVGGLSPSDRPHLRIHGYDYKGGEGTVRRLVREHGLESWVELRGIITEPEKTTFLQRSRGYVHPSRWESHSIALLENLALGVPTLISTAIHYAWEIAGSSAAILADPTEESLAEGLRCLCKADPQLSERARRFVGKRFAWDSLLSEYIAALHGLGVE